jgi:hypothetical protein
MKLNSISSFVQCGCEAGRKLLLYELHQERHNKSNT